MRFDKIAREIGALTTRKNKVYGNSFGKTADFIKLLYPEGIRVEQYNDVLLLARIFDKLVRIATGAKNEENPYFDIAGYAILGVDMKHPKGVPKLKATSTTFTTTVKRKKRLPSK